MPPSAQNANPPPSSPFLLTVCQVGAEAVLKKELARTHPELRFAYSRPGFVTFKHSESASAFESSFKLNSVFARAYALSFGKIHATRPETLTEFFEFAQALRGPDGRRKLRLHIWERDQYFPGDEPLGHVDGEWSAAASKAIHSRPEARALFEKTDTPREGECVVDVVAVEAGDWWYGYHRHDSNHHPLPGGKPGIALPPESPSRAYVKLEEALLWSGALVRKGDVAVEIGSAPGGASYALLQRGVQVTGIDPAEMHPTLLKHPAFRHIQRPVAQIPREDLPSSVEWLLLDMNVEPRISVFAVDRLATRMRGSLLGVLLTIKLNQWKVADEIPVIMEHVRVMGMARVRATQLASNRQEILIFGLTHKGMLRHK